jgi:hypothetical protein
MLDVMAFLRRNEAFSDRGKTYPVVALHQLPLGYLMQHGEALRDVGTELADSLRAADAAVVSKRS